MADSSQPQSTRQQTYLVDVTDEEMQKLQQSGIHVQALRRALIRIPDEEMQKLRLSVDRVEAADRAAPSHHHHDDSTRILEDLEAAKRQTPTA